MLPEERYSAILRRLKQNRVVTVHELVTALSSSAPTIRRDLAYLHNKGLLQKVHGGAASLTIGHTTTDIDMLPKSVMYRDAKESIALAASELISPSGFIFIDAGSTTEMVLHYLQHTNATFVTNGIHHATHLASRHLKVILLGGTVNPISSSIVGSVALNQLESYNFTQGFFSTHGISFKSGFTTEDPLDASVKEKALQKCHNAFVLADPSKFDRISSVTFATIDKASIITTKLPNELYRNYANIQEVDHHR